MILIGVFANQQMNLKISSFRDVDVVQTDLPNEYCKRFDILRNNNFHFTAHINFHIMPSASPLTSSTNQNAR